MAEIRRCNRCGNPLPSDAPEGTCPACMLRAGLEPDSEPPPDGSAGEDVTFGFEPTQPGHVLESLARSIGPIPRVLLPDTATDDAGVAVIKPSSDEMPAPGGAWRPLPALRRDRAGRDGGGPQGARPRPGPRPGRQGPAREPPGQARAGPPVRRGSADRRPAPASRHRAGLRAGHLRRPPALLHDEAGQGPDAGGAAGGAPIARARPSPLPVHLRGHLPDGGLRPRPRA